MFTNQTNIHFI